MSGRYQDFPPGLTIPFPLDRAKGDARRQGGFRVAASDAQTGHVHPVRQSALDELLLKRGQLHRLTGFRPLGNAQAFKEANCFGGRFHANLSTKGLGEGIDRPMKRICAILFLLGSSPSFANPVELICTIFNADGEDMDLQMSLDFADLTLTGGGETARLIDQTDDLLFFRSTAEMNGVYRVNEVVVNQTNRQVWISNFTTENGFFTVGGLCVPASGN